MNVFWDLYLLSVVYFSKYLFGLGKSLKDLIVSSRKNFFLNLSFYFVVNCLELLPEGPWSFTAKSLLQSIYYFGTLYDEGSCNELMVLMRQMNLVEKSEINLIGSENEMNPRKVYRI
jgi:hypothetical protein